MSIETDRAFISPEEEEAIVPSPIPGANQTRTKQIVAAIGTVIVVAISAYETGQFDIAEIVQAVVGLVTVLGVGEIPNKAA